MHDFERDHQDGFPAVYAARDHEKDGQTITAGMQGWMIGEIDPGQVGIKWQGTPEPLAYSKAELDELTQAQALSLADRARAAQNRQALTPSRERDRGPEIER